MTVESMPRLQAQIFRGTLLMALLFGAVSPAFRADIVAKVVGVICAVVLAGLAAPRFLNVRRSG
jgi:hypothetical protein